MTPQSRWIQTVTHQARAGLPCLPWARSKGKAPALTIRPLTTPRKRRACIA